MANTYIAYHFTIEPKELGTEILIAQLEEINKLLRINMQFQKYMQNLNVAAN